MKNKLVALHGFLGNREDWAPFEFEQLEAWDLWGFSGWNSLWQWGEQLNSIAIRQAIKPVVMGYSLGGRVALHALIQNPSCWQAAVLISTHPGLSDPLEKQRRIERDERWAKEFENQEWEELLKRWNEQEIFATDRFVWQRKEERYRREALAWTLRYGSLGRQEDLVSAIAHLPQPLLWLVGQEDKTYFNLAHSLTFAHPHSRMVSFPLVGHRFPWSIPLLFKKEVTRFLESFG